MKLLVMVRASEFRRWAGRPSHEIYAEAESLERRADSLREQAARLRKLADLRLSVELEASVGGIQ